MRILSNSGPDGTVFSELSAICRRRTARSLGNSGDAYKRISERPYRSNARSWKIHTTSPFVRRSNGECYPTKGDARSDPIPTRSNRARRAAAERKAPKTVVIARLRVIDHPIQRDVEEVRAVKGQRTPARTGTRAELIRLEKTTAVIPATQTSGVTPATSSATRPTIPPARNFRQRRSSSKQLPYNLFQRYKPTCRTVRKNCQSAALTRKTRGRAGRCNSSPVRAS